jgi:hypothetical protein
LNYPADMNISIPISEWPPTQDRPLLQCSDLNF